MPSHNIPPSMLSTFPVAIRNRPSAVTSKNDSLTDAVCFHWAVLRFFHCCCFYYLCSSIIFVLTCVLSRCLRVASSPLQSSLHLIHPTSLRRRYHPQPRQLELSLVVPLIIDQMLSLTVHQILKRALSWRNHPYDATRRQQLLLRVVGKAGVGKSHLIKAIVAGMELIGRKHEVIVPQLTILMEIHTTVL